jgi:hypothetical protein
VKWAGHVALMEEIRNPYTVLVGKLEGRDLLKDRDVIPNII